MFPHNILSAAAMSLLDSANAPEAKSTRQRLDDADSYGMAGSASSFALQQTAVHAAASVQSWVESEDMDTGEGMTDRLIGMLVGVANDDPNGELSEDEQSVYQIAANAAWDYMAAKGVAESDLDAMFNSDDPAMANEAGTRAAEFLADALPDGDEAAADELDSFAFGSDGQDAVFDGVAALDAVYKKRFAIRAGKKVKINKRISGHVRLSAAQKVSIRKAHLKANSAGAKARRMKSMKMSRRMGLGAAHK